MFNKFTTGYRKAYSHFRKIFRYPFLNLNSVFIRKHFLKVSRGGYTLNPAISDGLISPRDNNFDLLRLLAALQVVFFHANEYMKLELKDVLYYAARVIQFFPGVPIFFVISGFLIAMSYERNQNLRVYFENRFLRLYPALWVCFFVSIIILWFFGFLNYRFIMAPEFFPWILTQLTFFQFFNPDQLRGFGIGSVNCSLWTIPVEVQFYAFVPILFFIMKKFRLWISSELCLLFLLISSFLLYYYFNINYADSELIIIKLVWESLLPHLFMFLLGWFFYRHFNKFKRFIMGKALYWISLYIAYETFFYFGLEYSVYKNPLFLIIARFILAISVISFAFSFKGLSRRILRGNDISYGVYIYHAVILNIMLELGMGNTLADWGYLFVLSSMAAFLSWKLIEAPSLRLKKVSLRPL
jgi:peptidoglycan/LPS O-acetylase OafA/YrhL